MNEEKIPIRVEISYKTVIFTLAVLIALWLIIQIREIIVLVFISLILLSALLRPVEWLNARKIPRVISALIVYIILIALISFGISIIVPPLISQTSEFISKLPQIIWTINEFLVFNQIPGENLSSIISTQIQQFGGDLISISSKIFSSIILVVTMFVFTFYLILEWKNVIRLAASSFSGKQEKKITNIISKVEKGLGGWVRGQLTLSITVGLLAYIGLRILALPFALPLALITGILEIIPIVGPIIAAIPATLVGLSISPVLALATIAVFIVVHQLENHLVVPMVMAKVVGIQPPVVIIALLIGAKLAGIGGAFLVIPVIIVAKIIIKELLVEEHLEDGIAEE